MSANPGVEQLTIRSRQLLALFERVPVESYRRLLLLLSCLWLLWLLADIFWLMMPAPSPLVTSSSSLSPVQVFRPVDSKQKTIDLATMQSWHLFGEQNQEDVVETTTTPVNSDVDENAKETRLSLRLEGIVEAKDPSNGWAIIEHQSKSDLYKVGQALPVGNGVTLSRVLSDRAIIDNRGSYEALFLYDEKGNRVKSESRKPAPIDSAKQKKTVDQRSNKRLSKMAADYRQQLLNDPMSLADVIRISPANDSDGNLMGYRVRPGKHRQQFTEFGLKTGDIVTSVNGVELSDPSNTMSLYQDLRNTTEATIKVKRGSEIISLMIGIGDN